MMENLHNNFLEQINQISYESLQNALVSIYDSGITVKNSFRMPGGDINKAYGMVLSNGVYVFMKANEKNKIKSFEVEAANLLAIKKTNTIRVPKVLGYGQEKGEDVGYSFLLLEFINYDDLNDKFWEKLAQKLILMHLSPCDEFVKTDSSCNKKFGFFTDNYIGHTNQINTAKETWIEFFQENRLEYQFKLAEKYFSKDEIKKIQKLIDNVPKILVEPEKPSLLHGDLWSGNILSDRKSNPVLIDPACYVGHAEADIAMTELFGGFSSRFYEVYKESNLLQEDYHKRRDLYNLYHILNHLNMFGHSYLPAAKNIVDSYLNF